VSGVYGITGRVTPLTANATTYLWGLVSGSSSGDGLLTWFDVTMDSGSVGQGCYVELFRATGGIPTATAYNSQVANKLSSDAQTVSGLASFWVPPVTVTPTGLQTIKNWYLPPGGGVLIQYPMSREDYLPAGTTQWTGARITTPSGVSPDCAFNVAWNE